MTLFQPRKQGSNDKNFITFTKIYNPNNRFSFSPKKHASTRETLN